MQTVLNTRKRDMTHLLTHTHTHTHWHTHTHTQVSHVYRCFGPGGCRVKAEWGVDCA